LTKVEIDAWLTENYTRLLRFIVIKYKTSAENAEDILHNAVVKLYFYDNVKNNIKAYMETIIRTCFLSMLKDNRTTHGAISNSTTDSIEDVEVPSEETTPFEKVLAAEVLRFQDCLPVGQNGKANNQIQIFNSYMKWWDYNDVASELGLSYANVKASIHIIFNKFRMALC
jgi:DNA-directed RNA polymerase specialized sigma24 family protein